MKACYHAAAAALVLALVVYAPSATAYGTLDEESSIAPSPSMAAGFGFPMPSYSNVAFGFSIIVYAIGVLVY